MPDRPPDSAGLRAWLDSHLNLERLVGVPGSSPDGSRRRRFADGGLVELLGSPQLQYPAIHITGTNGKASAARIITSLLVSAGLSVGTDTSPYLERLNERMCWNGEPIPDDDLDRILAEIAELELVLAERPSYFEIINAAALEWFADVAVDVAVIEVGLGGRWDSTNVVDGRVAVVTNVELDHVEYLGPTRVGIAEEKAGIVKPGSTLVLGETDPELVPIFTARDPDESWPAAATSACAPNELAVGGRLVELFTPYATLHRHVPPAARRAPGRQRRGRARRRRSASSTARSGTRSSRLRSRRWSRPGGSRSSATVRSS